MVAIRPDDLVPRESTGERHRGDGRGDRILRPRVPRSRTARRAGAELHFSSTACRIAVGARVALAADPEPGADLPGGGGVSAITSAGRPDPIGRAVAAVCGSRAIGARRRDAAPRFRRPCSSSRCSSTRSSTASSCPSSRRGRRILANYQRFFSDPLFRQHHRTTLWIALPVTILNLGARHPDRLPGAADAPPAAADHHPGAADHARHGAGRRRHAELSRAAGLVQPHA